MRNNEEEEK